MNLCEASNELKERYLEATPSSVVFDGITWMGLLISAESIQSIKGKKFGKNDIVIASYPKAGRTWAMEIVSAIVNEGDIDLLRSIRIEERATWMEKKGLSADQAASAPAKKKIWITHLPVRLLPSSILEGNCKLLYLARNPKDQAVSYFHMHKISKHHGFQNDLTWDEYFRLYCSGSLCFGSYFEHARDYWKFTRNNSNAKFVFYEDMKKDLIEAVQSIEEFVGVPLSEEKRSTVVDHCSFESMKENKMTNRSLSVTLDHKAGKFMRKGIVGDWKNYFTVDQNDAFDELCEKKLKGSGLQFKFE